MSQLTVKVNSTAVTNRLWQKRLTMSLTQNGYSSDILLDYSDLAESDVADLPVKGDRFTIDIPNKSSSGSVVGAQTLVFRARTISKVMERYGDPTEPIWIHDFTCVDPITYLNNAALPNFVPFVNATTGEIIAALLNFYDSTLDTSGLQRGNNVPALNLSEFSSFGDVLTSEIAAGGYVVRMGLGNLVQGDFETNFGNEDYRADKNDYRYTPTRMDVTPPQETWDSATVTSNLQTPAYLWAEYNEIDARVEGSIPLKASVFGLADDEALLLTGGTDFSNPVQYLVTGDVESLSSNYIIFGTTGTLKVLDARPFVFPYNTNWIEIRAQADGGTFSFGFQDQTGSFVVALKDTDFSSIQQDTPTLQHIYGGYTVTKPDGTIAIWAIQLDQNFQADVTVQIATITSISGTTITIDQPWNVGSDFIRIVAPDHVTERGRATILQRSQDGLTLELDQIPFSVTVGDGVYLGVAATQTVTIRNVRNLSGFTAANGYGIPVLTGSNIAIQSFLVQRQPQIHGRLLSESVPNPHSTYPRDLIINTEVTEISDMVVSGSGSASTLALDTKFSTAPRVELTYAYVVGESGRKFNCGSSGLNHLQFVANQEQDPAVLQQIVNRLCVLGAQNLPRIDVNIESSEVRGIPLPYDFMPVNLPAPYRVTGPIPIEKVDFSYKGSDLNTDDDILMLNITAGPKTATERVQEELLRGVGVTKYPIRVATISGVDITSVNWNDKADNLKATVVGGTVIGPHNEVLDLAGGFSPAKIAGVARPALSPVVVRCTVATSRPLPDRVAFTVVYPPNGVDPTTLRTQVNEQSRIANWFWTLPDGAIKQNIYRVNQNLATGGYNPSGVAASGLVLADTVVAPAASWQGEVTSIDHSIWVESVGLCDKKSSKILLTVPLPQLPAPNPFRVLKPMNQNGRTVMLIGPAPSGDAFSQATYLRLLVRQSPSGIVYTQRSDFPDDEDDVLRIDYPVKAKNTPRRYHFLYDLHQQNNFDVYAAALWVDQFGAEGIMTTPINVVNPPFTVGSISPTSFFRSPDSMASSSTNQANGGSFVDDIGTTPRIENSGVYRINEGINNDWIKIFFERSAATHNDSVGSFVGANPMLVGSGRQDVTNDELVAGVKDISVTQEFFWKPNKHWTYRPSIIVFGSAFPRQVTGSDGKIQFLKAKRYLIGVDGDPTGMPIVPYVTDGYFDKSQFEFKPWLATAPTGQGDGNEGPVINPQVVGTLPLAGTLIDVLTYNSLCFVVANDVAAPSGTLYTIDVSDPSTPTLLSTHTLEEPIRPFCRKTIACDGPNVYIAINDLDSSRAAMVVDVSDPANPVTLNPLIYGGLGVNSIRSLVVHGSRLYVIDGDTLFVFDITDPNSISFLGLHVGGGGPIEEYRDLVVKRHKAYIAVKTNEGHGSMYIENVLDPTSISQIGDIDIVNIESESINIRKHVVFLGSGVDSSSVGRISLIDVTVPGSLSVLSSINTGNSTVERVSAQTNFIYSSANDDIINAFNYKNRMAPATAGQITAADQLVTFYQATPFLYVISKSPNTQLQIYKIGEGFVTDNTITAQEQMLTPHLVGIGPTPTLDLGPAAGTGATVEITGSDLSGKIHLLTGSSPTANDTIFSMNFGSDFGTPPNLVIFPADSNAAALSPLPYASDDATTTTDVDIKIGSPGLAAGTLYKFKYMIMEG